MPVRPRPTLLVLIGAWFCSFGGFIAHAHDIPNARIERATQVILAAGRLRVAYEVVLAELTLAQDLRQLDGEGFSGDRAALFERYARVVGPLNARGLLVQVDGADIDLEPVDFAIVVEDHPRLTFQFAAAIPARGRLSLVDTNYAAAEGSTRLALRVEPGLRVQGDLPPDDVATIPLRPAWQLTDAEERRTKRLIVTYEPGIDGEITRVPPGRTPSPLPDATTRPPSRLTRLLDQPTGATVAGLLATALALGMIHALQPGHGKTLVAAASLSGPHAAWRGACLGAITASCHLISVVAIAAVLWSFRTDRFESIHLGIARGAGFLIAAIGIYRVGRHLAGFVDTHDHPARSYPGIWSLGLAAGFVPCWDAVALVVIANSIGRLGWGLVLLVAFSLGLGIILVAVGWSAGWVRTRIGTARASARAYRWLGLVSGVILAAIGIGLLGS